METSRRALQKVGVRRCAGRPLGRVIHDRAKGSEKPKATNVALDGEGDMCVRHGHGLRAEERCRGVITG